MKLTRKERRQQWRDSWKTDNFEGETRQEKRRNWFASWSKFKSV